MPDIVCHRCGKPAEPERHVYVWPVCYACLPPPLSLRQAAVDLRKAGLSDNPAEWATIGTDGEPMTLDAIETRLRALGGEV